MEKYRKICVRVNNGSGFIISSESKKSYYIITARHCITGKDNELNVDNIDIWTNKLEEKVYFSVLDKFYDTEGEDIAIIEISDTIKFADGSTKCIREMDFLYETLVLNEENDCCNFRLLMYGFSEESRKLSIDLQLKSIEITVRANKNELVFDDTSLKYKGNENESSQLNGFSGSGIFLENQKYLSIMGIFYKYSGESGQGYTANKILEMFNHYKLERPLTSSALFLYELNKIIDDQILWIQKNDPNNTKLIRIFNQFKKLTPIESNNLKTIYKSFNLNEREVLNKELLKSILIFLSLIKNVDRNFILDVENFGIKINKTLNFLFKTENIEYTAEMIKSELLELLDTKKMKISNEGILYTYHMSNTQDTPFKCNCSEEGSTTYLNELVKNIPILSSFFSKKSYNNNDFFTLPNYENVKIKCADCFSMKNKVVGETIIKKENYYDK